MELSTNYLGFTLADPIIPGASPLADSLDSVRRLEDAGAPMVVLRSLFAEQISESRGRWFMHPFRYMTNPEPFVFEPQQYLGHIQQVREALGDSVPLVASLNVAEPGRWIEFAQQIEEAGANALELNIYGIIGDVDNDATSVESSIVQMIEMLKALIKIPLAVKLYPCYTSLSHFVHRLTTVGAGGVILFNRLYQPDIDLEEKEEQPYLTLSSSSELPLRTRAVAMLHSRVSANLVVAGGVHTAQDVVKSVMCGADAVQVVSVLLQRGIEHLKVLRKEFAQWLEEHEYESLGQLSGIMSLRHFSDPAEFERKYYMQILQQWQV